jgi:transcriptional regulator with XRE-family HTH domain
MVIGLAETLRALRKYRGLSQRELAERVGHHENTIIRLERWPARASVQLLTEVCSALEFDAWKLLKRVQKQQHVVAKEKSSEIARRSAS